MGKTVVVPTTSRTRTWTSSSTAPTRKRWPRFWAAALGYRAVGFGDPYFLLLPAQRAYPPVILQRVPEPKQGKARIHFDLRVADVEAEVRRLEALGARRIDIGQGDEVAWVPMADPEGNEFCVCPGAPLDV